MSRQLKVDLELNDGGVDTVTLHRVTTAADLADLTQWVTARAGQVLGLDAEATGFAHWSPDYRVRTVQLADADESWIVDLAEIAAADLAPIIHGHDRWIAHNAKYDIRALRRCVPGAVREDLTRPHIADLLEVMPHYEPRTTVAAKDGADIRLMLKAGLKECGARYLTPGLIAAEEALHAHFHATRPKGVNGKLKIAGWGFANADTSTDEFLTYAGLDPLVAVRLWERCLGKLRALGVWEKVSEDLWLQWVVDLATDRGMGLDADYVRWLSDQLNEVRATAQPVLDRHGIDSADAHKQIKLRLLELGAKSPKISPKTKEPSFDKTVLAALADTPGEIGELIRSIQLARRAGKFHASYVAPMLAALERDGAIHPQYQSNNTSTSRMAAKEPPVQQFPKRDTRIRAACRAPDGWVLVGADFPQIEPRVMAVLSGDDALKATIASDDLNSAVAELSFERPIDRKRAKDDVTSDEYAMRQKAKAAFLAWCYGAQPARVASTLGLPDARGEEIVRRWREAYPDLAKFVRRLSSGKAVRLPTGRLCPLWDRYMIGRDGEPMIRRGRNSRLGLNYATQGTARDVLAFALGRLRHTEWIKYLWALIHDELILCVPIELAEQARAALSAAMTMTFGDIVIKTEAEVIGTHWAPKPDAFTLHVTDDEEEAA